MMSDSGVWVDPTLLRKRLICWDRPDFFNLGTPPMRSTAGYSFSSDCFRLHMSLAKPEGKCSNSKRLVPGSREGLVLPKGILCVFSRHEKARSFRFNLGSHLAAGGANFTAPMGALDPKSLAINPRRGGELKTPPDNKRDTTGEAISFTVRLRRAMAAVKSRRRARLPSVEA